MLRLSTLLSAFVVSSLLCSGGSASSSLRAVVPCGSSSALASGASFLPGVAANTASPAPIAKDAITGSVQILSDVHQITVDGKPFHIKGVAYSPVPIGESPSFIPGGDYFTVDYQYIWRRDLPLIKAMGANTIRIYSWSPLADHLPFLDAAAQSGLHVIPTHYIGTSEETPVSTAAEQQTAIDEFVQQVRRYGDHPALLMWMFGNELNGPWNGFMKDFSEFGKCDWTIDCTTWKETTGQCYTTIGCVYTQLFGWMERAMKEAKKYTTRPMMSGFADVDNIVSNNPLTDRAPRFAHLMPSMDAWGMQLYRGKSFGNYFDLFAAEMNSSLIITEYGVDAYNDPCGWPENKAMQPCTNKVGDGIGGPRGTKNCLKGDCSLPGEQAQAVYDFALANEIEQSVKVKGPVVGGFLIGWVDEYWKGTGSQDQCVKQSCPLLEIDTCLTTNKTLYTVNGPAGCTYKAHISCPNANSTQQDLCGYWLGSSPDSYINEQWFGITEPTPCAPIDQKPTGQRYQVNQLRLKPAYAAMAKLWGGAGADGSTATCAQLDACHQCTSTSAFSSLTAQNACQAECGFTYTGSTAISGTAAPKYGNVTSVANLGAQQVLSSKSSAQRSHISLASAIAVGASMMMAALLL